MAGYRKEEELYFRVVGAEGMQCFYPNCGSRGHRLKSGDEVVVWNANIPLEVIYERFPAVVKLAIQENCNDYESKYQKMGFDIFLHPECAMEWGAHLIQDSMRASDKVGRILSGRIKHAKE